MGRASDWGEDEGWAGSSNAYNGAKRYRGRHILSNTYTMGSHASMSELTEETP